MRITVGPFLANTRSRPEPPMSWVSSSSTIFTTCWPGFSDSSTSAPSARSFTAAVNSFTTLKFTSASSRARRTWRMALEHVVLGQLAARADVAEGLLEAV